MFFNPRLYFKIFVSLYMHFFPLEKETVRSKEAVKYHILNIAIQLIHLHIWKTEINNSDRTFINLDLKLDLIKKSFMSWLL